MGSFQAFLVITPPMSSPHRRIINKDAHTFPRITLASSKLYLHWQEQLIALKCLRLHCLLCRRFNKTLALCQARRGCYLSRCIHALLRNVVFSELMACAGHMLTCGSMSMLKLVNEVLLAGLARLISSRSGRQPGTTAAARIVSVLGERKTLLGPYHC